MPGGTRQASANRLKRTISGVPSVTYHLNPTFAAVVLAASLLASSNFAFAVDAVSSASKVPAATADAPALEGVRTMATKGGDKLPDNVDAVTSASVVPAKFRQTEYKPKGFTDAKDKNAFCLS